MDRSPLIALGFVALVGWTSADTPQSRELSYNRDVRPILSDKCFACHGPDASTRAADLRLDVREEAIEYGALAPGDAESSTLVERIGETDPEFVMPPPEAHKELSAVEKATLIRWIEEGAEYEAHWAYEPIARPETPSAVDGAAARSPVDAFVQRRLTERGLSPSPQADRATLLRRLSLDLTGLPPTADEVAAFVADASEDAYELQVDRLLASPHYGERMAQGWLDVARYADTVGFHGDQNQHVWPYRDYVIRSFNENKPFDEFTREQIAGDLLPNPTEEQLTATCFNRLNMMTREGGAQAKEYLAIYTADRVRTVSMAFLGSTFGCAQCHDHKFDPISQKDFYSLGAFFADVKQYGVYTDYDSSPEPELKGFNNHYPFPPERLVSSATLQRRLESFRAECREIERSAETNSEAFRQWRDSAMRFADEHVTGWETPLPTVRDREGLEPTDPVAQRESPAEKTDQHDATDEKTAAPCFRVEGNHAVFFPIAARQHIEVELSPTHRAVASIRVELPAHPEHGGRVLVSPEPTDLQVRIVLIDGEGRSIVPVRHATANLSEPQFISGDEVIGVQSLWRLDSAAFDQTHSAVFVLEKPLVLPAEGRLAVSIKTLSHAFPWKAPPTEELRRLGSVRVSTSPFSPLDLRDHTLPRDIRTRLEDDGFAQQVFVRTASAPAPQYDRLIEVERAILETREARVPVLVTERTDNPLTVRLLARGDWQDESGEVCPPATPSFLPAGEFDDRDGLSRLDLAEWLCSDENPLTARVVVNRMWRRFFGEGLSAQVDDLGAQGEAPSHPELLDWLASEFRDSGWDVKHLVRTIVTSHTYRQSSRLSPAALDIDPNNRLLASQTPRRLDAEQVRDNALAIAGAINLEIGGPAIRAYQPDGHLSGLQFPDRRYAADDDARQHRRGLYMHWQRTFLHPMLVNFDAPSREDCVAMRTMSNSPQQALTLLNDPSMVEAARLWAERLIRVDSSDEERIDSAFRTAIARGPSSAEAASLTAFLAEARQTYTDDPEQADRLAAIGISPLDAAADPIELAAWTNVARVILNLHETITRY